MKRWAGMAAGLGAAFTIALCGCGGGNNNTATPAALTVSTTQSQLTAATEGTPYSFTFSATGGTAPYSWNDVGLPLDGLSLNLSTGALSGTPTANGTLSFTIWASDSAGDLSPEATFNLTINAPGGLAATENAARIATVAGTGTPGFSGDGAAATTAALNQPAAVAVDAQGDIFVADTLNNRVREIAASGPITTIAGNGQAGYSGDGGAASAAALNQPRGVAVDASGDVFIADSGNNVIRRVAAGSIATVAGTGTAGYSGDGGAATAARLYAPAGISLDREGNLYVADEGNNAVRRIAASGVIATVAGDGQAGFSGDGAAATQAALNHPDDVAVDGGGNLFIADMGNHRIRKVTTPAGTIATVAGTGTAGFAGDGAAATSAQMNTPAGLAVDAAGNIYVADIANNRVREIAAGSGTITTLAGTGQGGYNGDGMAPTAAQLWAPQAVAVDANGDIYIADTLNARVREIGATGQQP